MMSLDFQRDLMETNCKDTGPKEAIENIMTKFISKEIGIEYSGVGRGKKRPFNETEFCKLLQGNRKHFDIILN